MPLSIYSVPILNITIGDFTILISLILTFFIFCYDKKLKINKNFLLYMMYIIIQTVFFYVIGLFNIHSDLLSTLRYVLYLFFVILSSNQTLDLTFFKRLYIPLSIFVSTYAIFQFICFYSLDIILPVNILKLPITSEAGNIYSSGIIELYRNGSVLFRSYSIFLEPSYYAIFIMPCIFFLTKEKNSFKRNIYFIILFFGILCTTSTTAYCIVMFTFLPILFRVFLKKLTVKKILLYFSVTSILLLIVIGFFIFVVGDNNRIISSIIGRFENYLSISNHFQSMLEILFGNGLWFDTNFLPSYGRILVSFGAIGSIFVLCILINQYFKSNSEGKYIFKIVLLLFLGTNTFFNISFLFIFSIISVCGFDNNKNLLILYK